MLPFISVGSAGQFSVICITAYLSRAFRFIIAMLPVLVCFISMIMGKKYQIDVVDETFWGTWNLGSLIHTFTWLYRWISLRILSFFYQIYCFIYFWDSKLAEVFYQFDSARPSFHPFLCPFTRFSIRSSFYLGKI